MMVIFLVGLVTMILMRTLRKDYARYSKDEEMDDMVNFFHHAQFPLFIYYFFIIRNATWEMNTAGNRFTVTCSDPHLMPRSSLH